jgi:hypothetical protein
MSADVLPDEVDDIDAAVAKGRGEGCYRFRLGGRVFTLPSLKDLDTNDVESLTLNTQLRILEGGLDSNLEFFELWRGQIKLGLGDEQFAEFEKIKEARTLRVIKHISEAWLTKSGLAEPVEVEGCDDDTT